MRREWAEGLGKGEEEGRRESNEDEERKEMA